MPNPFGVEDFPHHPKRVFCHGIKQDTKRLLGRYFCAGTTFPQVASAFLAEKTLLACHDAAFNRLS
jgi:hypothetical protein